MIPHFLLLLFPTSLLSHLLLFSFRILFLMHCIPTVCYYATQASCLVQLFSVFGGCVQNTDSGSVGVHLPKLQQSAGLLNVFAQRQCFELWPNGFLENSESTDIFPKFQSLEQLVIWFNALNQQVSVSMFVTRSSCCLAGSGPFPGISFSTRDKNWCTEQHSN